MFNKKENELSPLKSAESDSFFHTMQSDLKNPFKKAGYQAPQQIQKQKNTADSKPFTPNDNNGNHSENTSPFLEEATLPVPTAELLKQELPKNNSSQNKNGEPFFSEVDTKNLPKKTNRGLDIALVLVSLSIIALGVYFFWMTRTDVEPEASPDQQVLPTETTEEVIENEPVVINPELEQYSIENPNVISIDMESASDQSIRDLLKKKASDLANLQIKKPIEFVITDKNNSPVAFPIFALTSKITLSQELLNNLEEKFSIYLYPESFGIRIGLVIKTKNSDVVLTKMLAQEKTLVNDLDILFLENKPSTEGNVLFKDSKYSTFNIRYLNLNQDATYSLDYTVSNSQLLIGTSKGTVRALIDLTTTPIFEKSPLPASEELTVPATEPE